jgi:deoxyribodipyrimidine photo-lyase
VLQPAQSSGDCLHLGRYWGKKIVEWSPTYSAALRTMIYLHDRPWPERPIFGTMRSMTLAGMRRKTNVDAYIKAMGGGL